MNILYPVHPVPCTSRIPYRSGSRSISTMTPPLHITIPVPTCGTSMEKRSAHRMATEALFRALCSASASSLDLSSCSHGRGKGGRWASADSLDLSSYNSGETEGVLGLRQQLGCGRGRSDLRKVHQRQGERTTLLPTPHSRHLHAALRPIQAASRAAPPT